MAPRMLAARWSPAKSVTKLALRNAASATGITPRPNWLHASHEELIAALAPALEKAGVLITARLDRTPRAGGRELYQSDARWAVRRMAMDGPPGHFTWNAQTGKFSAHFPGPRYAAARAAVEEAVRTAEANASLNRVDTRNQLALAIMQHAPVAPFCPLEHIEPQFSVWVLGQDTREFGEARRFLQRAGSPLLDLCEIEGPPGAMRKAVQFSLISAHRRYGTRTGWLAIADSAHNALTEALS